MKFQKKYQIITNNPNKKNLIMYFKLIKLYLGIKIEYTHIWIWLNQWTYIRKLFNKYSMIRCTSSKIYIDRDIQLQKQIHSNQIDFDNYLSPVDILIYIINIQLDI